MMYNNKFVATVKSGGKVLREVGDTVYLPFGCEYSILLKNLNTVRAQATITIDGEDVLNGSALVINPNSDLELERYLKDLDKGNRFKFIERSASVEEHRGVGASDGLVRIEFQYEIPRPINMPSITWGSTNNTWNSHISLNSFNVGGALRGVDFSNGEYSRAAAASEITKYCNATGVSQSVSSVHDGMATMDWCDTGITVPGSMSSQKFQTVSPLTLDPTKHAIVLQLKGDLGDNKVTAPVTVKSKPKCVTCGKVNKATSKFCSNCGTSLEIV